MDDKWFVDGVHKLEPKDAPNILNWYRNLYYKEELTTERGIVADALNDILPDYVKQKEQLDKLNKLCNWFESLSETEITIDGIDENGDIKLFGDLWKALKDEYGIVIRDGKIC